MSDERQDRRRGGDLKGFSPCQVNSRAAMNWVLKILLLILGVAQIGWGFLKIVRIASSESAWDMMLGLEGDPDSSKILLFHRVLDEFKGDWNWVMISGCLVCLCAGLIKAKQTQ